MAQPAVNDVLTWDGTKGVYAPNPALSLALTDSYIFVGNSVGVATGVALTLNPTAGTFALDNTGALTLPNASAAGRGLLNASGWATAGYLYNDGAGNLTFQAVAGAQSLAQVLAVGNATNEIAIVSNNGASELSIHNTEVSFQYSYTGGYNYLEAADTDFRLFRSTGDVYTTLVFSDTAALLSYYSGVKIGSVNISEAQLSITHDDLVSVNAPLINFSLGTASRAMYLDASFNVAYSVVTDTELGYLTGATSPLQAQIDAIVSGLSWKQAVRVRTTGNITLSGTQTIDGIAVIANDRVLVMDQTDPKENGIYVCSAGAWSRSTDADTGAELLQATVATQEGTLYADQQYVCTTDAPIVIGVSNIVFILVGGTTYVGTTNRITVTGNVIDIASTYLGQTSITTLGTITTGVWNGTTITDSYIATSYIKADGTRALTGDWAAGAYSITSKNMAVTGTGGLGYYDFIAQSSNASAPAATGFRLFSGSTGNLRWAKKNGADTFVRGLVGTFTADRDQTLQDTTDTFVYLATTDTLTNKRITKRVVSTTQSATPAINSDNGDIFTITGLAQAVTSFTTNLTGTPTQGQLISIEITDNGTARALTFGASFAAAGTLALPTTTVASTLLKCLFQYDTTTSKWVICAVV